MLWQQGNQLAPVFVPNISAADDTVSGVRELQFPDLSQAVLNR
jgi:peptide/nickel transport system substrate-binding protein